MVRRQLSSPVVKKTFKKIEETDQITVFVATQANTQPKSLSSKPNTPDKSSKTVPNDVVNQSVSCESPESIHHTQPSDSLQKTLQQMSRDLEIMESSPNERKPPKQPSCQLKSNRNTLSRKKKRKWITGSIAAVLFLMIGLLIYTGNQLLNAFTLGYFQIGKSDLRQHNIEIEKTPFTVLLLGTDQRKADSTNWRPDTIMVAAVNPKTNSIHLYSLPRDLKVKMPTGEVTKLNHAPQIGYKHQINPIKNIRETVENFLNIPIDYYAIINFQGFTDIVNAVGGIDVYVKKPFSEKMIGGEIAYFEQGPAHLSGEEALAYVRMRKQDPLGDMARNERQREVLTVLMDKLVSTDGLFNLDKILKAVGANFTHNFNTEDIPSLANIYRKSRNNLLRYEFRSEGAKINGIWYELWSTQERTHVSTLLQKQLEYQPTTPLEPSPLSEWEENYAARHDNDSEPVYEENIKVEDALNRD